MDLGPRAGDVVASFEDLVFAAASLMVFLGPRPPPMPTVPLPPPSPLPSLAGLEATPVGRRARDDRHPNESNALSFVPPPVVADGGMSGDGLPAMSSASGVAAGGGEGGGLRGAEAGVSGSKALGSLSEMSRLSSGKLGEAALPTGEVGR